MNENKEKVKGIHEGHRERLKNRFLNEGADSFEAHNILELLLFYSIPYKDTNPLAHELIKKFGSVGAVLDAEVDDLIQVKGISTHSAILIKLISEFSKRYHREELGTKIRFKDIDEVGKYLVKLYAGATEEIVYLLCLTASGELLLAEKLHEGSVNSASITVRGIIETVVKIKASSVILAHNHPRGIAFPSDDDIRTTKALAEALLISDIVMHEHIIVAGKDYIGIMKNVKESRPPKGLKQYFALNTWYDKESEPRDI